MKNIFTVVLLYAVCAALPVHAAGSYIGAAFGTQQATLNEREQALADRVASEQNAQDGSGSYSLKPWGWTGKIYGGYWLNEQLGIEAQIVNLGNLDSTLVFAHKDSFGTISGKAADHTSLRAAAVMLTGVLPTQAGLGLTGRLGLTRWRMAFASERECTDDGVTPRCKLFVAQGAARTAYGTGITYGLGLMYVLTPQLSARADWDRYNDVGDNHTGGKTDINTLVLGIDYNFGEVPLRRPSSFTLDTRRIYYGAGLSMNTLASTRWGIGAQVLTGYDTGLAVGRMALDAELGYLNTGNMKFDTRMDSRVATRAAGVWLSGVARVPVSHGWEALGRVGGDFGDDAGLLLGFGAALELTRDVKLRVEYVLRENIDALQVNVIYRP
ncbi:MAG: outer membrane beta-barrel protein [Gammaproteobacteria bacterium]|nr:outer membrane beta-barrel protein [Gammaproteobacteria bacterium]